MSGLNRELQRNNAPFSVLDEGDIRFRDLLKTLDSRFRDLLKTLDSLSCELHKQGVGVVKHSVKVIDLEHKAVFWERSLLGFLHPRFFNIPFFKCWSQFCS